MSYVKLCQISNQTINQVFYLEDCTGKILINLASYDVPFQCEIIDFGTEENYNIKGPCLSFTSVTVTLSTAPIESIRKSIFTQLQASYPALVI